MRDGNDPIEGPEELDNDIEIEFIDEDGGLMPVEGNSTPATDVEESSVQEEVERLKSELDHVRDIYLRKLAEFDNYRKRTEREREGGELTMLARAKAHEEITFCCQRTVFGKET